MTATKPIKPHNCIMGFGIPTSKEVFFSDQNNADKDFAKMFNGLWSKYYHQFIKELNLIEPKLLEIGLKIKHNVTIQDYQQMFDNNDVVVLFSHWKKDNIEFADGLKNIKEIVDRIPDDFCGIIDLCVCHPDNLAILIREKKPNCLVRYIPRKATPFFWLHFYLILFNYLQEKDISYLTALEDVIIEFLKSTK